VAKVRKDGLTVVELQEQIFNREGFRVAFERLGRDDEPLAPYDFPVMAPVGWRISDWQRMRLGRYLTTFKRVTVFRGDGTPQKRDVKLGHLRDSYYEATYGTLAPELPENVISLDERRRKEAR
jgi:hypothetical protein